jgi:hypothetical protein
VRGRQDGRLAGTCRVRVSLVEAPRDHESSRREGESDGVDGTLRGPPA